MAVLRLDSMSVSDKLQAMEELWADLSKDPDQIPIPQWHKDLLDERLKAIESGAAEFVDWETAKKRIGARTT